MPFNPWPLLDTLHTVYSVETKDLKKERNFVFEIVTFIFHLSTASQISHKIKKFLSFYDDFWFQQFGIIRDNMTKHGLRHDNPYK